jgi:hypothetical protein
MLPSGSKRLPKRFQTQKCLTVLSGGGAFRRRVRSRSLPNSPLLSLRRLHFHLLAFWPPSGRVFRKPTKAVGHAPRQPQRPKAASALRLPPVPSHGRSRRLAVGAASDFRRYELAMPLPMERCARTPSPSASRTPTLAGWGLCTDRQQSEAAGSCASPSDSTRTRAPARTRTRTRTHKSARAPPPPAHGTPAESGCLLAVRASTARLQA